MSEKKDQKETGFNIDSEESAYDVISSLLKDNLLESYDPRQGERKGQPFSEEEEAEKKKIIERHLAGLSKEAFEYFKGKGEESISEEKLVRFILKNRKIGKAKAFSKAVKTILNKNNMSEKMPNNTPKKDENNDVSKEEEYKPDEDDSTYTSEGEDGDIRAEDLEKDKYKPDEDAEPMESRIHEEYLDKRGKEIAEVEEKKDGMKNDKEKFNFDEIKEELERQADEKRVEEKDKDVESSSERSRSGREILSEQEAVKFKADKFYEDLASSQKRFNKAKNNYGVWKNLMRMMKGSAADVLKSDKDKFEESRKRTEERVQAKEEYEKAKYQIEKDKTKWREAYEEYCKSIINENKRELLKTAPTEESDDFRKAVATFMVSEKIVDTKREKINEKGETEKVQEKVSLIEDYNNKLRGLDNVKIENADDKTKKALKAAWNFYKERPRWQKIALGAVLAGVSAGMTGGAVAGLGYGAYRLAKSGASAGLTTGLGLLFTKNLKKFEAKERGKMEEKIGKKYQEGAGGFLQAVEEYNKKIQKKKRNDSLKILGTAAVVGGASNIFNHEILDVLSGGTKISLGDVDPKHFHDPRGTNIGATVDARMDPDAMKGYGGGAKAVSGEEFFKAEPEKWKSHYEGKGTKEFFGENNDKSSINAGVAKGSEEVIQMNPKMEEFKVIGRLGEGGKVWNTLIKSDQFDGNETKVANALVAFKKEMAKKLVEEQGMNQTEANKFISWRFTHMQPDDEVIIKNNGSIDIKGFEDKAIVDGHGVSEIAKNIREEADKAAGHEAPKFEAGEDNLVPENLNMKEEVAQHYEGNGKTPETEDILEKNSAPQDTGSENASSGIEKVMKDKWGNDITVLKSTNNFGGSLNIQNDKIIVNNQSFKLDHNTKNIKIGTLGEGKDLAVLIENKDGTTNRLIVNGSNGHYNLFKSVKNGSEIRIGSGETAS